MLGKRLLEECVHRSSPSNRSVQAPYAEPNRCIGATPQVKHPVQLNYINLMLRLNCFFQAKEGRYEEALDAHKQTAHFIQYVAQLEECGALKLEQFDFPAK